MKYFTKETQKIDKKFENFYSIHYASSSFYSGGAIAPSISAIALTNILTEEITVFSLADYFKENLCFIDAEKKLLASFIEFCKSNKIIFIHWYMGNLAFGFKALLSRCENFGFDDFNFVKNRTIDLSIDFSGCTLAEVLKEFNFISVEFLYGRQEASCFEQRNFNLIKHSTISKSFGIAKIFQEKIKSVKDFEEKIGFSDLSFNNAASEDADETYIDTGEDETEEFEKNISNS